MTRKQAKIQCHGSIHARPAAILLNLRQRFAGTELKMSRAGEDAIDAVHFDSFLSFIIAEYNDGEEVILEATGEEEESATEIFQFALQNLKDSEQARKNREDIDYKKIENELLAAIKYKFPAGKSRAADAQVGSPTIEPARNASGPAFAYLNDRLHNLTVLVLPAVARHYDCTIELRFEIRSGVHVCKLHPTADELELTGILKAAPEAGTRITILVYGERRDEACTTTQAILNNLRQCDEWLRRRKSSLHRDFDVGELIAFAQSIARLPKEAATELYRTEISKLLSEDRIVVYLPSTALSKEEILHQLVALLSTHYPALNEEDVLASVWARERQEPVILRKGLAVPHASVAYGPRIAIAIAVVPKGVEWDSSKPKVQLIILIVFADDTHQTYLEHVGQLAALLKSNANLQDAVVSAGTAREVVRLIRESEEALR